MRVVARIQAHPSRSHLHQDLATSLAPIPAEIVLDESDPPNPWSGYQRCLSDLPSYAKHVLVVQDDAQVAHNFGEAVQQIARDVPVVLFLARLPRRTSRDALKAAKDGRRYVPVHFHDFVPAVAILWPVQKALELMEWVGSGVSLPGQLNPRSDDAVLGHWMRKTKQTILCTVPSIVQHPDEEPSLIGRQAHWGRDSGRIAQWFVEDALEYDWSVR